MTKYRALMFNRRFIPITAAILFGIAITVGAWTANSLTGRTVPQSKEKVIERGNLIYNSDPIKLSDIRVANRQVKLNEKFEGDDDWLKGATFKLKNISNKEIVHVQLDFDFPETTQNGAVMTYQMMLGHRPGFINTSVPPLSLPPNGELNVVVDEQVYTNFTKLVSYRQAIQSITKVKVRIAFIVFADGTGYGPGGTFYRQDPNNPKRYLPISSNQPEKGTS